MRRGLRLLVGVALIATLGGCSVLNDLPLIGGSDAGGLNRTPSDRGLQLPNT